MMFAAAKIRRCLLVSPALLFILLCPSLHGQEPGERQSSPDGWRSQTLRLAQADGESSRSASDELFGDNGPGESTGEAATADPATVQAQLAQLRQQLQKTNEQLTALAENSENNTARIGQLHDELRQTIVQLEQAIANQLQILEAIAQRDAAGNYVPRLSANMNNSPEFAREFGSAIHQAMRRTGTLTIVNSTADEQRIEVNDRTITIAPQAERTVELPVGTATTRLPNQELITWTIGPPDYREAIEIYHRTVTYRPSTTDSPSDRQTVHYAPGSSTSTPHTVYYPADSGIPPGHTVLYPSATATQAQTVYYPSTEVTPLSPQTVYYPPAAVSASQPQAIWTPSVTPVIVDPFPFLWP